MPYDNFPKDIPTDKIDACVHDVMGKGHPKPAAIAICYDSMVKGKELLQAMKEYTEKETGPANDYLIVEDAKAPSTYHLRVKVNGKPDHTLMGAAWAALMNPNGYRGNKYEGPGKQEAIAKLRKLYEAEGMPVPSEKEAANVIIPEGATIREVMQMAEADLDSVELSDEEKRTIEQLYRDVKDGKVNPDTLDVPTGKAVNNTPGGGTPGGSPGGNSGHGHTLHGGKMKKCYLHVRNIGGDEEMARRICKPALGLHAPKDLTAKEASFTVYKQADGHYRWLAVTSSSFQDRDKEIVSQKALEADTERMNTTKEFGTLDWWHTPIVLGACDFSAMHGRLSVESGTFRDAWIAEKMAQGEYEMSRAFYHPITEPDPQGVYHNIKTFSRAIIPQGIGKASNLLTTFTVIKEEKEMLMDKVKELVTKFGGDKQAEEKVNALLAEAEQKEKAAEVAGIAAKEQKPEATPAPEQAPAPAGKPEPAPAEEKKEAAPILEQTGMFVSDMKPEEFDAHIATAINAAVKPLLEQLNALKEANAVAVKESSANVLAAVLEQIGKMEKAQAETAQQVKELNGLTPRGYRATQDPATATTKDAKPAPDEKANSFTNFVNRMVLGQTGPTPPAP